MKKTILSVALALVIGAGSAFANTNDGISSSVKSSFNHDFKTATNVQWQETTNFDKATFVVNNQVMFAYYDPSGMLLAVSRNIVSENLPINLQTELKRNYNNFWITNLFENASRGETTYYITLENADQKIILKSIDSSDWSVFKKTDKIVE